MISDPWLLVFCVFGLLVLLGTTSGLINARLWVSEPLACVAVGIVIGPLGFGLVRLDPAHSEFAASLLEEGARVTLALAVVGAAMRLPGGWLRSHWRAMLVPLGPGMLLMWGAGSLVAGVALGLNLVGCMLIGAAVSPTDPVLSAPLLTGSLAERAVPRICGTD
jgi:NhaP-type Na+/H+ or K+/H+ antiporter